MNPEDEGNPKKIRNIASSVRKNAAHTVDARNYLTRFCRLEEGEELPDDLLAFFQDGFLAYLEGNAKSVDQALGLTRSGRGRPPSDLYENRLLATKVLESRVAGSNLQEALEKVAERQDCGKTKVGDAWGKHKENALYMIQFLRSLNGQGQFTDAEWERIRKIYEKDPATLERWPRNGDY